MPMFVMAGSINIAATSPVAKAASAAAKSLNGTTMVVSAGSTCGPMLFSRETVLPASSKLAKVSSTVP